MLGRGTPEIYINNRKVRDITELSRLRTIRRHGQGLSSSLYTEYTQGHAPIANEGISLNYRTGELDIFIKTDFAEVNNYSTGTTLQNIYASSEWNHTIESTDKQTYRTFNGELGFNYEVNQDQSFGMRYMPGTWYNISIICHAPKLLDKRIHFRYPRNVPPEELLTALNDLGIAHFEMKHERIVVNAPHT